MKETNGRRKKAEALTRGETNRKLSQKERFIKILGNERLFDFNMLNFSKRQKTKNKISKIL